MFPTLVLPFVPHPSSTATPNFHQAPPPHYFCATNSQWEIFNVHFITLISKLMFIGWAITKVHKNAQWRRWRLSHSKLPYCYQKNYWINPFIRLLTRNFQIIWQENEAYWNVTAFLFFIVHLKVTSKTWSDYLTYWFGLRSPVLGLD